jgi:hypothetical protein
MIRARQIVTTIVALHFACASFAEALPDHDNGPLTGIFGFPQSTEGGVVVGRGQHSWNTSYILSSHNIDETRESEYLGFDGETARLAFTYRYGLSDTFDIGIEVPYLSHQPGHLDSLIDGWHDLLVFPSGGARAVRERNQLDFLYADSQTTIVDLTDDVSGLGDLRLMVGWSLSKKENRSTALRFGIKFPTGDSDELLGSGGTDVSLGLASDATEFLGKARLSGFYRANVTYLGEPDLLADRYNRFVGQLSFGFGYHLRQNVDINLQSRIRSPVYDSETENLGKSSVTLTFGADFRLSDHYRLVLAMGEDVRPGSAPDVSFQIALRYAGQEK